jgi:hypothetical protein
MRPSEWVAAIVGICTLVGFLYKFWSIVDARSRADKARMDDIKNAMGVYDDILDEVIFYLQLPQDHLNFQTEKKRNEYGQVAPGQTFTDSEGKVVPHPVTGQPLIFTVWRKINLPAAIPVENALADKLAETESAGSTQPVVAAT